MLARTPAARRRGSTIVESALVLAVFMLILFGLFEYCRFLMVLHVTNNAARDGARFASVNVNCPADQVAAKRTEIINYTTARLGGTQKNIQGMQIAVFPVDQDGLSETPVVIRSQPLKKDPPVAAGTYPDPYNQADANTPPWNQAAFTERVAVQIKGTFRPIAPLSISIGRLKLSIIPDNIPINVTALMGSEG